MADNFISVDDLTRGHLVKKTVTFGVMKTNYDFGLCLPLRFS